MTEIATSTGSKVGLQILLALLLMTALAIPAMAHEGKVEFGIQAVTITSATRPTLGTVTVRAR